MKNRNLNIAPLLISGLASLGGAGVQMLDPCKIGCSFKKSGSERENCKADCDAKDLQMAYLSNPAAAPAPKASSIIPGIDNTTALIVAGGLSALLLFNKNKKSSK